MLIVEVCIEQPESARPFWDQPMHRMSVDWMVKLGMKKCCLAVKLKDFKVANSCPGKENVYTGHFCDWRISLTKLTGSLVKPLSNDSCLLFDIGPFSIHLRSIHPFKPIAHSPDGSSTSLNTPICFRLSFSCSIAAYQASASGQAITLA